MVAVSDSCGNTAEAEILVNAGQFMSCSSCDNWTCSTQATCDFGYRVAPDDCTYNGSACTDATDVGIYRVQDCAMCCYPGFDCGSNNTQTCSSDCCSYTSGSASTFSCPCEGPPVQHQTFTVYCEWIGSMNYWTCAP